ncbi:hypothetical protein AAKU55_003737 [Oxalobacteraceae bacterium GrIS 1.11]
MSIDQARKLLILASLAITGCQMLFLLLAPVFGFPLPYPRNLDLLQLVSPVFLGYLGAASHFVFQVPAPAMPVQNQYLGILLIGPLTLYVIAASASLVAFGYSNRTGASVGHGMSVDNLATALSLCLGLLAATTGVLSSYLFMAASRQQGTRPDLHTTLPP